MEKKNLKFRLHFRNRLIFFLFKKTFPIYFLIAFAVTIIQIYGEFRLQVNSVRQEMDALNQTFSPFVENSLWLYDRDGVQTGIQGILNTASITRVEVQDYESGKTYSSEKHPPEDWQFPGWLREKITRQYPLYFEGEKQLGVLIIESDGNAVISRISQSVLYIGINALIKTLALWVLFFWVFQRKIIRPLKKIQKNLDEIIVLDENSSQGNEIDRVDSGIMNLKNHIQNNAALIGELSALLKKSFRHSEKEVRESIDKLSKNLKQMSKEGEQTLLVENTSEEIWIKEEQDWVSVGIDEVAHIRITEHYLSITYLQKDQWKTRHQFGSLKEFEDQFPDRWIRISRNSLINPEFILSKDFDADIVVMNDGQKTQIPMSASGKKKLKRKIALEAKP